jgi:hypothetical protein
MQGGDFGMTARFSRIGVDTRTLTSWGTLETRIEGDFGGGSPTSSNALFRLRQAWAELGTEEFRVLIGQANSLWNEGVFETLIDATNLNQSFVRQAQLRVTGRLASGLIGQVSLEVPETQYTSAAGVFTPDSSVTGSPSPAFNAAPDLLGRLTYRNDGLVLDMRGLLRQLSIRTAGTTAAPPALTRNAPGWGIAVHARLPMRWIADAFGPDELIGMAYYGQGIGRYFPGNTSGQDALSNIGLPGSFANFSLNPLPSYGAIVAYRRFWTPQLRSNISYAYAHEDYPSYALGFTPGSAAALALNSDMQQVFVNLIGVLRDGSRRDLQQRLARCRFRIRLHATRSVRRSSGRGFRRVRSWNRQSHPCRCGRTILRVPVQITPMARPTMGQVQCRHRLAYCGRGVE